MSRASYRRRSVVGAFILIVVGVLFLFANFYPDLDAWEIIWRYWPVILIVVGLGKLIDSFLSRRADDNSDPNARTGGNRYIGEALGIIVLLVLCVAAAAHTSRGGRINVAKNSIDLQGAKSVHASIKMPAGNLNLSGGAQPSHAFEGDFSYNNFHGEPDVHYSVSNDQGSLDVDQEEFGHIRPASGKNQWDIRLNDGATTDLDVKIGAGHAKLQLAGLGLDQLQVDMGAGSVEADLTGDWKKNVDVTIHGGVGSATVRLPKGIGVEVDAKNGLGMVSAPGMRKDGDSYVNDAFGKSPVTMHVTVEGGIGSIRLLE